MRVGVLGSGQVGQVLSDAFLSLGYEVMRGTREPQKLSGWLQTTQQAAAGRAQVGSFREAANFGELIVLAVKGSAALSALAGAGHDAFAGKTVLDTTNPIDDKPPTDGVLHYFTDANRALMEILQEAVPSAHFVKCFSSVGNALMFRPQLPGGPPTMFICGDHEPAKAQTRHILEEFGWEALDMGTAVAARAIEPLCILWCIQGFRNGTWNHAFKLLVP